MKTFDMHGPWCCRLVSQHLKAGEDGYRVRLKSQKAKLKSRGLSGIGRLLMCGERFLEKETAV